MSIATRKQKEKKKHGGEETASATVTLPKERLSLSELNTDTKERCRLPQPAQQGRKMRAQAPFDSVRFPGGVSLHNQCRHRRDTSFTVALTNTPASTPRAQKKKRRSWSLPFRSLLFRVALDTCTRWSTATPASSSQPASLLRDRNTQKARETARLLEARTYTPAENESVCPLV